MFLASDILSQSTSWSFNAIALALLLWCLYRAPWSLVWRNSTRQHLIYASLLGLLLLWHLQIKWLEGFALHPLGMTAVTLIIGWQFAFIIGVAAQLACVLLATAAIDSLGFNILLTVAVPIFVTSLMLRFSDALHWQNIFIYLLGVGFVGAILSVLAIALCFTALAYALDLFAVLEFIDQAPLILLLMFPEGFINGMLISAIAVFKPDWVKTFNDDFYIDGK